MRLNKKFKLTLLAFGLTAFSVQAQEQGTQPAPVTAAPAVQIPIASAVSNSVPIVTGLPDFTKIVKMTENGVVNIRTEEAISRRRSTFDGFGDFDDQDPEELFRFFFGPDFMPNQPRSPRSRRPDNNKNDKRTVPSGVGSGFVISKDGYIITNNHVIADAAKIIVTLNNGKEYTAKVIGSDERTDVALLKIEASGLEPLSIGSSENLQKGQWVLAIGSPFGLESTVTTGVVSAINRDTGEYLPFIQSDVAVNPGNSGGPLINLQGQVVGVNSQIISRSGGFMGISFSIPIDEAMKVVEQLKASGKVTRGRIGVAIGEVKEEVAKALGLPAASGAMVSSVEAGSPGERAGLQAGDVILKFNGKNLKKWSDLPRLVGQTAPGSDVVLEVWRRGKAKLVTAKVEDLSKKDGRSADTSTANVSTEDSRLGLTVKDIPNDLKAKYRIENGVLVTDVDGVAAEAGLKTDDILLVLNDQDIKNAGQFADIVKKLPKDKAAALLIRRDNMTQWVPVVPTK